MSYIDKVEQVATADVAGIKEKDAAYGGSWQKRGGVGAFMMLARKWDRIEVAVEKHNWDIFVTIIDDIREENTLDDIRDLRRYLTLVEAEIMDRIDLKEKERAVDNFRGARINYEESELARNARRGTVPIPRRGAPGHYSEDYPVTDGPSIGDAQ